MDARLPLAAKACRYPLGAASAAAHPQEFEAQVAERASLIERACLIADVTEVLGALPDPADMTVICAAFRSGYPDALGPVLVRILRKEWRELADVEITRELNDVERGVATADSIPDYVLARTVAIAQMGVRA